LESFHVTNKITMNHRHNWSLSWS